MRPLAPAELALAEVTARLERQLRVQSQQKVAAFERAMLALEAAEAAALAAVEQQQEEAAAALAAAEAAAEQQRAAQRSQLLTGLRSQHQAKAQEGQRKVQQLEAAVRQQAEAAAAAAAAAAKADQDRRAAAEAAAHAEQQRAAAAAEQAAAADKAAADAAAAKAQQKKAAVAAAAAQASGLRIAPSAAEWEKQCAEALAAAQVRRSCGGSWWDAGPVADMWVHVPVLGCVCLGAPPWMLLMHTALACTNPSLCIPPWQASVKPFVDDRAMRDKKRSIDKFVTLNVQQISATLEQVCAWPARAGHGWALPAVLRSRALASLGCGQQTYELPFSLPPAECRHTHPSCIKQDLPASAQIALSPATSRPCRCGSRPTPWCSSWGRSTARSAPTRCSPWPTS